MADAHARQPIVVELGLALHLRGLAIFAARALHLAAGMKEIDLANVFGGASRGGFLEAASRLGSSLAGPKVTLPQPPAANAPSIADRAKSWLRQGIQNGYFIQP